MKLGVGGFGVRFGHIHLLLSAVRAGEWFVDLVPARSIPEVSELELDQNCWTLQKSTNAYCQHARVLLET